MVHIGNMVVDNVHLAFQKRTKKLLAGNDPLVEFGLDRLENTARVLVLYHDVVIGKGRGDTLDAMAVVGTDKKNVIAVHFVLFSVDVVANRSVNRNEELPIIVAVHRVKFAILRVKRHID
jgi:hypothetical protein